MGWTDFFRFENKGRSLFLRLKVDDVALPQPSYKEKEGKIRLDIRFNESNLHKVNARAF